MPGGGSFFVDSNVLLYAVDAAEPEKQQIARSWLAALWEQGTGRLSWQVLHEFYANAERKIGLARAPARHTVGVFIQWRPVDTSLPLIERAWHWMDEAQLPYWDALIVAAAEHAGCDFLLSEDFQAGRSFGSLTVVNPFAEDPGRFGFGRRLH